jgi:TIR domain/WD domain, G-beta repeat
MSACDLFLSYHSPDHGSVHIIRQLLEARGIATFLDRENLVAGLPWPHALEEALGRVRAVAVFLGPDGLGLWQKREMGFALDRQVQEEKAGRVFPVIPVLLPGVDVTPGFLFLNTWVDLRRDLTAPEALDALALAVRNAAARPEAVRVAVCPYRSLGAFQEEHAAFFFGREAFADRLRDAALGRNLVAVVGPSGSGKSSVVQAGLLPLLCRQRPPAQTWDAVSFTPGMQPFHQLAAALIPLLEPGLSETDRLTEAQKLGNRLVCGEVHVEAAIERLVSKSEGTDRLLVVADHFEELFTQTPEAARKPFVEAMLGALDRAPLTLMLTLRADFYGHVIALSRELSDRVAQTVVNLGPMRREELERAIVEPARRVGLAFEPGLADRILDDVGEEPGHLPLLEFALTELWAQRQVRVLTHAAYRSIGGVAGAIAQRAEAEFEAFTPQQQVIARRVFTRLVRVARPQEGAEDTRQRATLAELSPHPQSDDAAEVGAIVQALTGWESRLLVTGLDQATGKETVEVAHEALIQHWERLRDWLDEDREFLLWHQRLRGSVAEWERTKHDAGSLLRGAPLAKAERWLNERPEDLTLAERNLIQESLAQREHEREVQEQRRRRFTWTAVGVAGVLLLFALLAWWQRNVAMNQAVLAQKARLDAETERDRAEQRRHVSLAQALAAQALRQHDQAKGERSALLARQAYLFNKGYQGRVLDQVDDTLRSVLSAPYFSHILRGHEDAVWSVAFSSDGQRLAAGSRDGTVRLWDVRQPEAPPPHPARP